MSAARLVIIVVPDAALTAATGIPITTGHRQPSGGGIDHSCHHSLSVANPTAALLGPAQAVHRPSAGGKEDKPAMAFLWCNSLWGNSLGDCLFSALLTMHSSWQANGGGASSMGCQLW